MTNESYSLALHLSLPSSPVKVAEMPERLGRIAAASDGVLMARAKQARAAHLRLPHDHPHGRTAISCSWCLRLTKVVKVDLLAFVEKVRFRPVLHWRRRRRVISVQLERQAVVLVSAAYAHHWRGRTWSYPCPNARPAA